MPKTKSFRQSLLHALEGIRDTFQTERNMKIHTAAVATVVIAGLLLKISGLEWIVCVVLFGLVIGAEMINTALEILVDITMPQRDHRAKRVKDTAAGAVLVTAFVALVAGLIIFVPKLLALIA